MLRAGKNDWYGCHDFRGAFATMNAERMDLLEVQALMRQKSLETTKLSINMAKRLAKPVSNLFVPPSLRTAETA